MNSPDATVSEETTVRPSPRWRSKGQIVRLLWGSGIGFCLGFVALWVFLRPYSASALTQNAIASAALVLPTVWLAIWPIDVLVPGVSPKYLSVSLVGGLVPGLVMGAPVAAAEGWGLASALFFGGIAFLAGSIVAVVTLLCVDRLTGWPEPPGRASTERKSGRIADR
ncbi:hypothetical protein GCM10010401_03660 [Rarobacter faecitabidus]|uniref:Uncharacterized protein n=1 Tax=Rarobacter faecitabidus TaxID=13243 RepID=A0A542ZU42_RARFA|nr:hypothetical protein [Rarobacter faecitabidus]TQL63878.1 hypothetical protein FB461_0357 [Rarobacter faecitabidus]